MFSVLVLCAASLLILAAPLMPGPGPHEMRPWLGAMPPFSFSPFASSRQEFVLGEISDCPGRLRDAGRLDIETELLEGEGDDFRVVIKNGMVSGIMNVREVAGLDELDLCAPGLAAVEILENGASGRSLAGWVLRVGKDAPKPWAQPGRRVIFIRVGQSCRSRISVRMQSGRVIGLQKDGRPSSREEIKGDSVSRVVTDGRERRCFFLLGTDKAGRDLFSRVLYGGRISLMIGLAATIVSVLIGVLYGAVSGYLGGRWDRLMMGSVDVLYALPFMFLVILLLVYFGRDLVVLFVALGAVQWLTTARIIRGQVLYLKQLDFIEAARACGTGGFGIVLRHLIPNTLGPVIVYTTLTVPAVILEESFLSYIGLTVQYRGQSLDSWGALIQQGVEAIGNSGENGWILLWPSAAMVLTLLCLNTLGDALRDAFDPQLKEKG